jgi:hypothetical protein
MCAFQWLGGDLAYRMLDANPRRVHATAPHISMRRTPVADPTNASAMSGFPYLRAWEALR